MVELKITFTANVLIASKTKKMIVYIGSFPFCVLKKRLHSFFSTFCHFFVIFLKTQNYLFVFSAPLGARLWRLGTSVQLGFSKTKNNLLRFKKKTEKMKYRPKKTVLLYFTR